MVDAFKALQSYSVDPSDRHYLIQRLRMLVQLSRIDGEYYLSAWKGTENMTANYVRNGLRSLINLDTNAFISHTDYVSRRFITDVKRLGLNLDSIPEDFRDQYNKLFKQATLMDLHR